MLKQGATIKKDEKTGAITIARIMKGGAADRSGEFYLLILTLSYSRLFFTPGLRLSNYHSTSLSSSCLLLLTFCSVNLYLVAVF